MNTSPLFGKRLIFACLCFIFLPLLNTAQSRYDMGWQALHNADVDSAIGHFQEAIKKGDNKESALLTLTMLYERINKEKEAAKTFQTFFTESDDPFPATYAMWFDEAVIGEQSGHRNEHQFDMLEAVKKDTRNVGKLDNAVNYRTGLHYVFSFDRKNALRYFDQINNIRDWAFTGPFDNVMNSGFNKSEEFGPLAHPEATATFKSKYGAPVSWFDPPLSQSDGYLFKKVHFSSNNSIIYAQNFIQVDQEQEVLLKLGYSGSLKIWINDEEIYSQPDKRVTELDYFTFKGKLNKGYNRILVQLGDFTEPWANFSIRFTDLNHKPLVFPHNNKMQTYAKNSGNFVEIPHFAISGLTKKASERPDDPLYNILLAKAYMRSHELDKAEAVLKALYDKAPKDYLCLLNLVLYYDKANNDTEQNRFYDIFTQLYPKDKDLLTNDINKYHEEENKTKVKELVAEYQEKYGTRYSEISYGLVLDKMDENYEAAIQKIETLYKEYPDDYQAVVAKYQIEKSLQTNPVAANKVLEKYLKSTFNYQVLEELANNYLKDGKTNKAIDLLEQSIALADYDLDTYNKIANIHSRKSDYDKAIKIIEKIVENRPSDYGALSSLGQMYNMKGDKKKAISYYESSLSYFPFKAETYDKIRELKGQKVTGDLVEKVTPEEVIADFEKNFTPTVKKPYDIVLDNKSMIIFNATATSQVQTYIIRINDESAIQDWQRWNLGGGGNMSLIINEAKTIKADGQKIDAERYGSEVVFTKLEIGDYLYVYFSEQQVGGGKSALFISDNYNLNSYYPIFKKSYTVYADEGTALVFKTLNTEMQPVKSKVAGFDTYHWEVTNSPVLKDESFTPAFSDISQNIHLSLDHSWYDIAQWYSDLSSHQARPDFTIEQLVKELFDGKNYTQKEKAKVIYDFVVKNIQYSSIDFRQSSHIPQKASDVYHSRLGDCKDISTLYASIAREAGLETNLVLINTRNNGQKDVILPSLNFNHCIVKVNFDEESHFLELTDPNLPYGNLYWYHDGAAILEIPNNTIPNDISLRYLPVNKGFKSTTTRTGTVMVNQSEQLTIEKRAVQKGLKASSMVNSYYNDDEKQRKESMKKSIASGFSSTVKLLDLNFEVMEPRNEECIYSYKYTVEDEVLKVGSFRSLEIPFSDVLVSKNILEKEEARNYIFNFLYYENCDVYDETLDLKLEAPLAFMEVPKDVHLEYKGFTYDMKFTKLSDQHLKINRVYQPEKRNIQPEEFEEFKKFVKEVLEAEKTNVVFK